MSIRDLRNNGIKKVHSVLLLSRHTTAPEMNMYPTATIKHKDQLQWNILGMIHITINVMDEQNVPKRTSI